VASRPAPESPPAPAAAPDKGLRPDAVGFWDGLAVSLDSTAPAYSLAAVLGSLVVVAGTRAPAVLVLSFVPILGIAVAFHLLNRTDQDCGTTFAWVSRALGPAAGWLAGWGVLVTGVLVVGSLADVAATYLYDLLGLDALAGSRPVVVVTAVVLILAMTWLCARGTELSARVQRVLVLTQVGALLLFVVAAAVQLGRGGGALRPSLRWLSPVGLDTDALVPGLLLGVFLYWGWESALNLTEESRDRARAPGRAALVATVVLLLTYVGVAVAVLAVAGTGAVAGYADDAGLLGAVAAQVLGPFAPLLVLAIVTSGVASTQSTLLPASRTALSMAAAGAFPRLFGRVDPRTATPVAGTWVVGLASAAWYVGASLVSDRFLSDSLSALSLLVALTYALTGLACVVLWRRQLLRSWRALLLAGAAPLLGVATLLVLLVRAAAGLADPSGSATGRTVLGVGLPLAMAGFFVLAGVAVLLACRRTGGAFFARRGGATVDGQDAAAALGLSRVAGPGTSRAAAPAGWRCR